MEIQKLDELKKLLSAEEKEEDDRIMYMHEVAEITREEYNFTRYKTGIHPIDEALKQSSKDDGGISGGEIMIIAGPTGNGKTLLASTIAYNLMRENGLPCAYFSYEVNIYSLWNSFKLMGATDKDLFCVPFKNTTGNIEWIEKKIIEAKKKFMAKVIVIDHLGFLAPKQKMGGNMQANYSVYLTQIVRELKNLAQQQDVIIILPAHVNKSSGSEPSMKDISHSGGIAQEADVVLMIAREENKENTNNYYTKFSKVFMAKNRIGENTPMLFMEKTAGKLVETVKTNDNTERAY